MLNIVRKLAETNWGARAGVLRAFYIGAVRSQMDYGLSVQVYATQASLACLDAVRNRGGGGEAVTIRLDGEGVVIFSEVN